MSVSTLHASLRYVALLLLLLSLAPSSAWSASCVPDSENNLQAIASIIGPSKRDQPKQADGQGEEKPEEPAKASDEKLKKEIKLLEEEIARLSDKLETSFEDVDMLLARARLRKQAGHRREAIEDFTKVIAAKGESPELLAERGELWTRLNEFERAEADLNRAVKLAPTDPDIYYARGKVYIEQWKTREAYGDFSKAIELDPKHKQARYERAYLLIGVSTGSANLKAAVADLEVVIELDPEFDKARFTYAHALWGINKNEEAVRQADIYLERHPDSECMYVLRSKAYRSLQKYDLALQDAQRYIDFDPQDNRRYYLTAHVYTDSEDYEKAIVDWSKYIEARPESVAARLNRARSFERRRRYEEALGDWDALVKLQPNEPDWRRFRANVKSDLHQYDSAMEDLQAAYDMSQHKGAVRGSMENLYKDMGEASKAFALQMETQKSVRHSQAKGKGQTPEESDQAVHDELGKHIEQAIVKIKSGNAIYGAEYRLHSYAETWGKQWLSAFVEMLADEDDKVRKAVLSNLETFRSRNEHYPYPKAEIDQLVGVLQQIAQNDPAKENRNQARTYAKVFGELQIYNNPETTIRLPGAIPNDQFDVPKDAKGRVGKFTNIGGMWLESKDGRSSGRYKEIARTPEHIDLLNVNNGGYVRLEATQARWSHDRKNWNLIGKGEFSMRK